MAKKSTSRTRASGGSDMLGQLGEIAANCWWTWNPAASDLFARANRSVFLASDKNPIVALSALSASQKRLLATDEEFVADVKATHSEFRQYMRGRTWYAAKYGKKVKGLTAYFCMEYALHESLPFYAGGLGVLAGDHLKSASDLGIPFVAIGIYWKKGYTRQYVDKSGHPTDEFRSLAPNKTPLAEVVKPNGRPLRLKIPMGSRKVVARAWRLDVGRVPLYLLDTDLPENTAQDRKLTHVLYSGDRDTRIRQEILLGIGGWGLIKELGLKVSACHLNEGHAAFLSLERITERMKLKKQGFKQAMAYVHRTSVFTTHTPVPAGNEEFDPALIDVYLKGYLKKLGLTHEEFHDLARVTPGNSAENFGMTPLALRTSKYANGVAALHGKIARRMWKRVYPGKKLTEVPIGHVTNGIHLKTWLHPEMGELLDEFLGDSWEDKQDLARTWAACKHIPDESLWKLHQKFKAELIDFCRQKVKEQIRRSRSRGMKIAEADKLLDPRALTIGFARRFAPYKRATLVFNDPGRLAKILNNRKMPVQLIFAGKAHPADSAGKELIEKLIEYSQQPRFRKRIVFIEDYEMDVARHMVAGVDIWLNNPERPREASGTSGMKPSLHGGLNLSILDGWWPEGFNRKNGWAIGKGKDHDGTNASNRRDANDLYRILEKEATVLYYERDGSGIPTRWPAMMKNALETIPVYFNTHRQVKEYLTKYYLPAMRNA